MFKHALRTLVAVTALPITAIAAQPAASPPAKNGADQELIQRGRYLVKVTGCNDCHTAGYATAGGKIAESKWLTGDTLGWRGAWGTTYAINLRLYMRDLSEKAWLQRAKTMEARPPMPWFALHDMTETDLKAIHRYITALGPAGEPAPAYVPPTKTPQGPYVQFPAPPK